MILNTILRDFRNRITKLEKGGDSTVPVSDLIVRKNEIVSFTLNSGEYLFIGDEFEIKDANDDLDIENLTYVYNSVSYNYLQLVNFSGFSYHMNVLDRRIDANNKTYTFRGITAKGNVLPYSENFAEANTYIDFLFTYSDNVSFLKEENDTSIYKDSNKTYIEIAEETTDIVQIGNSLFDMDNLSHGVFDMKIGIYLYLKEGHNKLYGRLTAFNNGASADTFNGEINLKLESF